MGDTLTDSILSILKERNILAKRDAIEFAFDGASGDSEWAVKHLRPDTLLSKEELALYVSHYYIATTYRDGSFPAII
jgi:hypothetical protein